MGIPPSLYQRLRSVRSSDLFFSALIFTPRQKITKDTGQQKKSATVSPQTRTKNPEAQKDLNQPKSALPTPTPNAEFYSSVDDLSQLHKGSFEHQQGSATGDSILPCGNQSKSISPNSGVKSGRTEARRVDPIAFMHRSYPGLCRPPRLHLIARM